MNIFSNKVNKDGFIWNLVSKMFMIEPENKCHYFLLGMVSAIFIGSFAYLYTNIIGLLILMSINFLVVFVTLADFVTREEIKDISFKDSTKFDYWVFKAFFITGLILIKVFYYLGNILKNKLDNCEKLEFTE